MLIRPSCSSNRCSTTNHRDNSRRTRYTHSKPRTLRRARSRSRFRLDQRRNRKCILSRSQRLLPDELRRAHIPPTRALELSRCKSAIPCTSPSQLGSSRMGFGEIETPCFGALEESEWDAGLGFSGGRCDGELCARGCLHGAVGGGSGGPRPIRIAGGW
jgi:hypothetical protein